MVQQWSSPTNIPGGYAIEPLWSVLSWGHINDLPVPVFVEGTLINLSIMHIGHNKDPLWPAYLEGTGRLPQYYLPDLHIDHILSSGRCLVWRQHADSQSGNSVWRYSCWKTVWVSRNNNIVGSIQWIMSRPLYNVTLYFISLADHCYSVVYQTPTEFQSLSNIPW